MTQSQSPTPLHPRNLRQPVPHFTGTLAMIWFLSGLGMLFGAGMLGYIMIRINRTDTVAIGSLQLPHSLWLSTALVVAASMTIQLAVSSIRRERQDRLRAWLVLTLLIGIAFCIVQTPALLSLLHQHQALSADYEAQRAAVAVAGGNKFAVHGNPLFGLIFIFILIHAAHVLGGIIQLITVARGAFLGRYDHEYYNPVKHAAMYWHFLDLVWLIMFGLMVGAG